MPRISDAERARRDVAYRRWIDNEGDFAATAAELGIAEKELRRWCNVHKWWKRWEEELQAELQALQQKVRDIKYSERLATGFEGEAIRPYVSTEMRIQAAHQVLRQILELGGEVAAVTRAAIKGMIPDAIIVLAQIAASVDEEGRPREVEPDVKQDAREAIVSTGLITMRELNQLPYPQLIETLKQRMREHGFESEPQA